MGDVCGKSMATTEDFENNARINAAMKQDAEVEAKVHKLLLLGPGESGKSTFYKQMRMNYGDGFSNEDREFMRENVGENVLIYLGLLARAVREHVENPTLEEEKFELMERLVTDDSFIYNYLKSWDNEKHEMIQSIWNHPDVQYVWAEKRSMTQVPESTPYFLNERMQEITKPDYLPSDEDVLRIRIRTTGVLKLKFTVAKEKFLIVDMGGQRSERKKWIRMFNDVQGILFLCDTGGYDRSVFEDQKTSRVHEALNVYDWIVHEDVLSRAGVILFLNKIDLFYEKIEHTPLSVCFEEYEGEEGNAEEAIEYITQKFRNIWPPEREFFVHLTCATDSKNCETVFLFVKDTLMRKAFEDAGMY